MRRLKTQPVDPSGDSWRRDCETSTLYFIRISTFDSLKMLFKKKKSELSLSLERMAVSPGKYDTVGSNLNLHPNNRPPQPHPHVLSTLLLVTRVPRPSPTPTCFHQALICTLTSKLPDTSLPTVVGRF